MKKYMWMLAALCVATVVSCSSDDGDDDGGKAGEPIKQEQLDGVWQLISDKASSGKETLYRANYCFFEDGYEYLHDLEDPLNVSDRSQYDLSKSSNLITMNDKPGVIDYRIKIAGDKMTFTWPGNEKYYGMTRTFKKVYNQVRPFGVYTYKYELEYSAEDNIWYYDDYKSDAGYLPYCAITWETFYEFKGKSKSDYSADEYKVIKIVPETDTELGELTIRIDGKDNLWYFAWQVTDLGTGLVLYNADFTKAFFLERYVTKTNTWK